MWLAVHVSMCRLYSVPLRMPLLDVPVRLRGMVAKGTNGRTHQTSCLLVAGPAGDLGCTSLIVLCMCNPDANLRRYVLSNKALEELASN